MVFSEFLSSTTPLSFHQCWTLTQSSNADAVLSDYLWLTYLKEPKGIRVIKMCIFKHTCVVIFRITCSSECFILWRNVIKCQCAILIANQATKYSVQALEKLWPTCMAADYWENLKLSVVSNALYVRFICNYWLGLMKLNVPFKYSSLFFMFAPCINSIKALFY